MTIEIVDVPVPERWDDDSEGARLLRQYVDVRNGVVVDLFGGDPSHAFTYRQAWAQWRSLLETSEAVRTLALLDGVPAGRGYAERSLLEAQTIGEVDVLVLPGSRGRGVGTALADDLLARLAAQGVTTEQAWVNHPPAPGPTLHPPTGFGAIPADTPAVRMLQRYGFALEQVERMSELSLAAAAPSLAEHRASAEERALPRYRVELWEGPTPPERIDALAALHARMSTDAPAAGLDHEAERWDAKRLASYERSQLEGGRTLLRAIAVETATDAVVAFTTLVSNTVPDRAVPDDAVPDDAVPDEAVPVEAVPVEAAPDGPSPDGPESAVPATASVHAWYQHDTLVHGDHRGHRLGMLVKAANLQALERRDATAVVRTWNATENTHMLAVNEALGFRRILDEGAWQRRAAP